MCILSGATWRKEKQVAAATRTPRLLNARESRGIAARAPLMPADCADWTRRSRGDFPSGQRAEIDAGIAGAVHPDEKDVLLICGSRRHRSIRGPLQCRPTQRSII